MHFLVPSTVSVIDVDATVSAYCYIVPAH